jgi:hypothetical protein
MHVEESGSNRTGRMLGGELDLDTYAEKKKQV